MEDKATCDDKLHTRMFSGLNWLRTEEKSTDFIRFSGKPKYFDIP